MEESSLCRGTEPPFSFNMRGGGGGRQQQQDFFCRRDVVFTSPDKNDKQTLICSVISPVDPSSSPLTPATGRSLHTSSSNRDEEGLGPVDVRLRGLCRA